MSKTLFHPYLADVSVQVDDDRPWVKAGWRSTNAKDATTKSGKKTKNSDTGE